MILTGCGPGASMTDTTTVEHAAQINTVTASWPGEAAFTCHSKESFWRAGEGN